MAKIHGPEQSVVVLYSMIKVLTGCIDPWQVFRVHKAQNMIHNLERKLCEENHGVCDGLVCTHATQPGGYGQRKGLFAQRTVRWIRAAIELRCDKRNYLINSLNEGSRAAGVRSVWAGGRMTARRWQSAK